VIKEAFAAYAEASTKPWVHDRGRTVGASEIGLCARKTWFVKHGQVPDSGYIDRWGAKRRGDLIEVFWVEALKHHFGPGVLHYAGRHQRTFIDEESSLSATPDGLVNDWHKGFCFLVECKSVDPRAKLEEARPEHIYQLQVQMGLVRKLTRFDPNFGILCYVDASFLDDTKEFKIDFNPEIFEQARLRAATIMLANRADDLRPEGYIAGAAECEYCQFRGSCSAMRAGAVPGKEARLSDKELELVADLARQSRSYKKVADEMELNAKDCESDIKEIMKNAGTRRVQGEGVSIVWSALKGRPNWDWPKLRAAAEKIGLDLAPFETVGNPSDRLDIRIK
jgi:hypothetical protein